MNKLFKSNPVKKSMDTNPKKSKTPSYEKYDHKFVKKNWIKTHFRLNFSLLFQSTGKHY